MATRDLSYYDPSGVPDASEMRFGIVVSDWNSEVTHSIVRHVPGTFELTLGSQWMAEYEDLDGVICLGCVIQGETPHFTYICQGVTRGITQLNLDYNIPFIFGVLTTLNLEQALDRAGGKHGNKGDEAAVTAIRMAALQRQMED